MKTFLYILLALVLLLVMIVIHELGHYIAGKILKFKINEFSVGFGPKILSKKKKNGETISLRAIPLGGYCAFEGESGLMENAGKEKLAVFEELDAAGDAAQPVDTNAAERPQESAQTAEPVSEQTQEHVRTFNEEKPWKRIIVLLAGGVANLLSAILFSFIFIWAIGYAAPTVDTVYVDATGVPFNAVQKGDIIRAVSGKKVSILNSYDDLVGKLKLDDGVVLTVERNGSTVDIVVVKKHVETEIEKEDGTKETLDYEGFGYASVLSYQKVGIGYALTYCVPYTFKLAWLVLKTFGLLFAGQVPISDLAGPAGTITMIADLAKTNWRNILILLPFIASNLGVFNLLPIPALDGSKVVFTVIEWIRGKPINPKVENTIHTVGLLALLGLVVVLDIMRFVIKLF